MGKPSRLYTTKSITIRMCDIVRYTNKIKALVYKIYSHQSLSYPAYSLLLCYVFALDVP